MNVLDAAAKKIVLFSLAIFSSGLVRKYIAKIEIKTANICNLFKFSPSINATITVNTTDIFCITVVIANPLV